ncbi:hypothetical protein NBRC116493_02570 [Aurantivibrio infirmus]
MPREKSRSEKLAGKLISTIQKVWSEQAGEPEAEESEIIMSLGHNLLQARSAENMKKILNGRRASQYIGDIWLQKNPSVKPIVSELNNEIYGNNA